MITKADTTMEFIEENITPFTSKMNISLNFNLKKWLSDVTEMYAALEVAIKSNDKNWIQNNLKISRELKSGLEIFNHIFNMSTFGNLDDAVSSKEKFFKSVDLETLTGFDILKIKEIIVRAQKQESVTSMVNLNIHKTDDDSTTLAKKELIEKFLTTGNVFKEPSDLVIHDENINEPVIASRYDLVDLIKKTKEGSGHDLNEVLSQIKSMAFTTGALVALESQRAKLKSGC